MPRAKVNGKKVKTIRWKPIEVVPRETNVTLKTVRGLIRSGLVPKGNKLKKADRHYPHGKRIAAKVTYPDKKWVRGDVSAVAWAK